MNAPNAYAKMVATRETRLARAEEHANYLLATYLPYTAWSFAWNNRVRALGVCKYKIKEIQLSKEWTVKTPWAEVDDTLRHEIAHAIAGYAANHGPEWQRVAETVGASTSRTYTGPVRTRDVHVPKYEMVDTTTGKIVQSYYRKPPASTLRSMPTRYMTGRKAETIGKLIIRQVDLIKELEL